MPPFEAPQAGEEEGDEVEVRESQPLEVRNCSCPVAFRGLRGLCGALFEWPELLGGPRALLLRGSDPATGGLEVKKRMCDGAMV